MCGGGSSLDVIRAQRELGALARPLTRPGAGLGSDQPLFPRRWKEAMLKSGEIKPPVKIRQVAFVFTQYSNC